MTHGTRLAKLMAMGLGLATAALLSGATPGTARTALAQERPTEGEELRARADALLARLPEIGRMRLSRDLKAWASFDADARNRLERWVDLLLPMSADELAQLLAPAAAAAADARMQKVGQLLDDALVSWTPKPVGRASDNRVVIVCVGGGYSSVVRTMSTSLASDKPVDAYMQLFGSGQHQIAAQPFELDIDVWRIDRGHTVARGHIVDHDRNRLRTPIESGTRNRMQPETGCECNRQHPLLPVLARKHEATLQPGLPTATRRPLQERFDISAKRGRISHLP